jgi:hypothetical protein
MYCKKCGHRSNEKTEECRKCGAKLAADVAYDRPARRRIRWRVPAAALVAGVLMLVVVPRVFLRSELETIGPTDKVRFLRAAGRSEYRRTGQRGIRIDGQTLTVTWDLRWNALPKSKQQEIVRIMGHAWAVVGGEDTRFRIEGEDQDVASYRNGSVSLKP